MSNYDLCAECYLPVRPRQEGLQCDGCLTQHRTCKTGISQREYREAMKSGQEIDWHCKNCTIGDCSATTNGASSLADDDAILPDEIGLSGK